MLLTCNRLEIGVSDPGERFSSDSSQALEVINSPQPHFPIPTYHPFLRAEGFALQVNRALLEVLHPQRIRSTAASRGPPTKTPIKSGKPQTRKLTNPRGRPMGVFLPPKFLSADLESPAKPRPRGHPKVTPTGAIHRIEKPLPLYA